MEPIIISVPIYIQTSKKSKFALNLNTYRNAHFHELNKAKVLFNDLMQPLMKSLPLMSSLKLTYNLFFGSKRAVDTANICCIVDKFFSDSLVHAGKIPDDNTNIISDIHYRFGGIDKDNPRIDVTIHDYEVVVQNIKEESMRIILVQSEIEEAIKSFVLSQIDLKDGQTVQIDFKNTRGDDGATAEINISVPKEKILAPLVSLKGNSGNQPAPVVEEVSKQLTVEKAAPVDTLSVTESRASEPTPKVVEVVASNPTSTPTSVQTTAAQSQNLITSTQEQTPAATEVTDPVEKPAAPKSLFAGLSKPVNN